MSSINWRNFKFFESEVVKGPLDRLEITCGCYGRSAIFFGDSDGFVYGFDRSGKSLVSYFQAYVGAVTHILHLRSRNVLITLGDDDALNAAILRVWDLDKRQQTQPGASGAQTTKGNGTASTPRQLGKADQPGKGSASANASEPDRPTCREHRIFTAKYPPPPESIPLRVNFNDAMLKTLKFFGKNAVTCGLNSGDAGKQAQSDESPRSTRSGAVPVQDYRTAVVSLDVTEDLQHAAVALVNGEVVVMKGDLEHERTLKMRRVRSGFARGKLTFCGYVPKTRVVAGGKATDASAGIVANVLPEKSDANQRGETSTAWNFQRSAFAAVAAGVHAGVGTIVGGGGIAGVGGYAASAAASSWQILYTVHEDVVTAWRVSPKGEYTEYHCEPPFGAAYECSAFTDEGQLVVASRSSNQVAMFGNETLMSDLATGHFDASSLGAVHFAEIDGFKKKVLAHRGYVVVLTQSETTPDRFQLQAYDLDNRLRGFSRSQETYSNVAWVLSDSTDVFVIAQEPKVDEVVTQKVSKLTEIDTQAKLEQLFNKECYDIAKKIARTMQAADSTQQMGIQRKYGDYLYAKGKYEEAIEQYIEAIGYLEPSYVIRLFLDGQRIVYLTRYLEELHHKRHGHLANKNHTTLLLNCYIKLRDEPKLREFIHRDDIRFDAHNAIKVCRQAGYYDSATYLAEKYAQPDDYVKIQLENLNRPVDALAFIRNLPVDEAETILREHGKDLVHRVPREATEMLIALATQWPGPSRRLQDDVVVLQNRGGGGGGGGVGGSGGGGASKKKPPRRSDAKDFIHVFVDSPASLLRFLRAVVDSGVLEMDGGADDAEQQRVVYNTLLELYLTRNLKATIKYSDAADNMRNAESSIQTNASINGASADNPVGSGAATGVVVDPYPKRLEQALAILESYAGRYDDYHALALVQQNDFEDGILFMLHRLHLFTEVFQHYASRFQYGSSEAIRSNAKSKLIQACQQQRTQREKEDIATETEKELWISLLSILVKSEDDVSQDIARVLEFLEKEDLLSPVAVIEILSANPKLQLRTVRDYILRTIRRDTSRIEANRASARETLQRTAATSRAVHEAMTAATVFQANKCAQCGSTLDLPAIHFMCHHSFHPRCLNDVAECNVCGPAHRRLAAEQRQLQEKAADPDEFFKALQGRNDGFEVVAEHFGKSILCAPALRKEALLFTSSGGHQTFNGDDADGEDGGVDDDGFAKGDNEDEDGYGDGLQTYAEDGELLQPEEVELW